MTVALRLPWPPSLNHYWRRSRQGGMHISAEGKAYKRQVGIYAASEGVRVPMTGRLAVEIHAYPPDRRARDLDNLQKALLDALEGSVYANDSQIDDLRILRCERVPGGQMTITVTPMEGRPDAA